MNSSEFKTWWEDFQGRFPSKAKSLGSDETRASWMEVLADVELDKALWASRSLQDGSESMPGSWDMIPARVRQIARQLAHEDAQTVGSSLKCRRCNDSGIVRVVETPKGRMAYVCDCEKGQKTRQWYGKDLAPAPVNMDPLTSDNSPPYSGDPAYCKWCGGKGWFLSKQGQKWHCRDCSAGEGKQHMDEGLGLREIMAGAKKP